MEVFNIGPEFLLYTKSKAFGAKMKDIKVVEETMWETSKTKSIVVEPEARSSHVSYLCNYHFSNPNSVLKSWNYSKEGIENGHT